MTAKTAAILLYFLLVSAPRVLLADGAPVAPLPRLVIEQTRLGNVFLANEPVTLSLPGTDADRVEWIATDAWGTRVAGGAAELGALPTLLTLPLSQTGHYEVALTATKAGAAVASGQTRVAVMGSFDLGKVEESPFAVMTHFAQSWAPDVLEIFARASIKHVRDEIYWEAIEKERGAFVFPPKFERYMAGLREQHMTPLTPLSFGNPNYDRVEGVPTWASAPYTQEGFEAYARYCTEVLKHYGDQIRYVEIWNEYNGAFAKGPAGGKPEVYAEMLKVAYRAIKAQRPDVTVLAGGTIHIPLDWLERMIETAGIENMDGISVHPYGYRLPPEIHIERLEKLRALIRRHNGGRDMPVWVTEQGWYTMKSGEEGNREPITPLTQACYLVRGWTVFLAHGVEKMFWYLGRDYNEFATMGLVGRPDDPYGKYAPKPALSAYAVLIRQLTGLKCVGRDESEPHIYSFRFAAQGRSLRVLWATQPADVALGAAGPLKVTDLMGRSLELHPVEGRVHLHLEGAPVYVEGAATAPTAASAFAVRIPSVVARDDSLPVEVVASVPTVELLIGGEKLRGLRVDLPAVPSEEERWVPLALQRDGRTVYAGAFHALAVPSFALDPGPRMSGIDTLEVSVANASARHAVRLSGARWAIAGKPQTQALDLAIEPGRIFVLELPVAGLEPFAIYDLQVEVTLEGGVAMQASSAVSYNPAEKRTIQIDGRLGDWDGLSGIDLSKAAWVKLGRLWGGPRDLGGDFRLCWDEDHLYLAARVEDDVFDQPHSGYNVWRGDNLQLGFSTGMPWEHDNATQELGLTLTKDGPEVFRFGGPGKRGVLDTVSLAVKREGAFTTYECAVPWSELGAALPREGAFSFGIFLNDSDGADRKGYLRWGDIKQPNKLQPVWLSASRQGPRGGAISLKR